MPRLHSGVATDKPEITNLILPPIPEVVWQQPQRLIQLKFIETSTTETHKNTHMPEFIERNDVESQTLSKKKTSPQVSGASTEPFLRNPTTTTPVQSLSDSK